MQELRHAEVRAASYGISVASPRKPDPGERPVGSQHSTRERLGYPVEILQAGIESRVRARATQPGLRGQRIGVRQLSERIWLVTFVHSDPLGYFDDETCLASLESIENPFGPKVLPMSPE